MITRIHIRGYRIYKDFNLFPNPKMNILVGGNDAGKSTLMEAVSLALNGRIGGRSVLEELNPHWFNTELVQEFVAQRTAGKKPALPEILIELYLRDDDELQVLCGAVNTAVPTHACPGVFLRIFPNEEYQDMLDDWLKAPIESFIKKGTALEATAAAAFYVAATRARQSLAIVIDKVGTSTLPVWAPSP
ncbi:MULTISPECIES: AAA family ATPase [Pseudomonas chlororaphis group]|uniref:AAA family ATPase n=1 Tax=Pseudomonas chlororaphis group TaxID=136842 RepID=UPI002097E566|nr:MULTISPECIES: AAA family ATPase [Pseudomonas chlororaphis group]MCO7577575.1 AAA family ATPase [Pseudomonas protegens]MCO7583709.1 AAA family ATPase [Pseudomonas chlororaphis]MCO7600958.1 AAA family ATPase [Pseudomonas chlororaphis]